MLILLLLLLLLLLLIDDGALIDVDAVEVDDDVVVVLQVFRDKKMRDAVDLLIFEMHRAD